VKATASNGEVLEDTVIGSGYNIYTAGEAAGKIKYEPTTISATSSYSGNNEYAVAITAKNSAGATVGTGSHTVDARDAYDDGYTDGWKAAAAMYSHDHKDGTVTITYPNATTIDTKETSTYKIGYYSNNDRSVT
jgi:hypothetical protein